MTILSNTAERIRRLKAMLEQLKCKGQPIGDVYAITINSGLCGVPWEEAKKVLEQGEVDIIVASPPPTGEDMERPVMTKRGSHKSTMQSPLTKKRKSMKAEGHGQRAGILRKRRNAHSLRNDDEDESCTH